LGRLSDPSLNIPNASVTKSSRSSSASGRPKVQRRSSSAALMHGDVEKATPTTTASELVVEALLDFIQSTTDVTEEEINMIMKTANKNASLSTEKRNREVHVGDRQEIECTTTARNPRQGRQQRSASLVRGSGGERSRSSSRTRLNSRSRRAVMSLRNSLNDDLDDGNRTYSPKRNHPSSERQSRPRQERHKKKVDDTSAATAPSEADSKERVSGSSRHTNSKSREPRPHSRSGSGCGRSLKRNDSGHGAQRRGGSLTGRRRRVASRDGIGKSDRGDGGDVPRRQIKSLHDPISLSGRSLQEELVEGREHSVSYKQSFERGNSFGSWSESPTVSEASDILDEDDLLIL
jgi:hypothetical protein